MILYHGTSVEAAENIIKENKINPSMFNILKYIEYILTNYETDTIELPKIYKINGATNNVYWLGNGIYAFGPSDYKIAKNWRTRYGNPKLAEEDCSVIQFEIAEETAKDCYDFTSYENRNEVKKFFEEYMVLIDERHEGESRDKLLILLSIIKDAFVNMEYIKQEHLLGLAIEMFLFNIEENIPFISATFYKNTKTKYYETYYSVRDTNLVENIK